MRLKNTLRNMVWNLISQISLIITGLMIKRVLLLNIGTEKIGLNYLFNDIVGLLSIAELGITSIIAYHLYEPLANGNEQQVIKIMGFFRKIYFLIGCIVVLVGIGLMPFLQLFTGDTTINYGYIQLAFVLFLLRNSEGYFLSYKSILPFADQKSYLLLVIDIISTLAYTIVSIFVILITKNYLYVLALEIVKKIINDFIMIHIVNKRYPYIKGRPKAILDRREILTIGRDIKNAFVSKVSKAVISTTDNIIISIFLGLNITGLFSNYALVLYTVQTMLYQLISSAQASIGNLIVTEKENVVQSVVNKMTFISFFMVSICGCILFSLTSPFVALFFGKEFLLGKIIVLVSVLNIFIDIMQRSMLQVSEAGGLFRQTKNINLISCIINVVISLISVKSLGLVGILLGTLISRIVEYILRIKVSFHEILKISHNKYLLKNLVYILLFLAELGLITLICNSIQISNTLIEFTVFAIISAAVPFIINIILFYKTEDFQYMMELIQLLIRRQQGILMDGSNDENK